MDVRSALRASVLITALAVAAAACAGDTDADPDPAAAGNAVHFCALWPDVRTTLLGAVSGEESFDLLGDESVGLDKLMVSHDLTMAEADAAVPAAVRRDWDVAYGAYTMVSDLLFTTGYSAAVMRPVHTDVAFGDAGYEATVADAEVAVAAIDDWSVEACGDFCARWPEFEYVVRYQPDFDWSLWHDNLDRYLLSLAIGDRLAPDAVKDEWDTAADIQRRRMTMFRDLDFSLDVDEETALDRWGVIPWDEAQRESDAALETIQIWADANCDSAVLTVGAPGSVSVRLPIQPELSSLTVLSALLPAGTEFGDLRDLDSYLAVMCSNTGGYPPDTRPEDLPAENLRPIARQGEYFTSDLCELVRHEEQAVVPGGAYELFVGAYFGGPGAYGLYLAAPEHCIQVPVGVNGATTVDVPPLEPCHLEPVGSVEEVARRRTPSDDASARLWIGLDRAMGPDGYDFCRMDVYVMPAGTTLNQIGRGEAWPVGTVNMHLISERHVEGRERRWAENAGRVPVLPMPPSGTGEVMVQPIFLPDGTWDAALPEPVLLSPGAYDVFVHYWCVEDEESGEEEGRCGRATVDVDGDTVVPLPELGECP